MFRRDENVGTVVAPIIDPILVTDAHADADADATSVGLEGRRQQPQR
ncbi:hypothetical protein [Arthrobacter sp. 92]|jgi:hypothetical protein